MSVLSIKSYINLPYSVFCYSIISFIHSMILDCFAAFQEHLDNQQFILF